MSKLNSQEFIQSKYSSNSYWFKVNILLNNKQDKIKFTFWGKSIRLIEIFNLLIIIKFLNFLYKKIEAYQKQGENPFFLSVLILIYGGI